MRLQLGVEGEAPHGRDSRSGGGTTLTRRGGDSGGCGNGGMRPNGGMEGPRHAGSAYAEDCGIAVHCRDTLLSHMALVCVYLRLEATSQSRQLIFDQRLWRNLYEFWRPLTNARTSGPNCSSLRAPMPGIATSAASSAGSASAIAMRVLSVKIT